MRAGKLEVTHSLIREQWKTGCVFKDVTSEDGRLKARHTALEGDEMVVVNSLLDKGWRLVTVLAEETRSVEVGRVESARVIRKVYYMTSAA